MHFMVLVECHHLAAGSYLTFINHFKPSVFLGMTATPERMDGKDIFELFHGKIAAEIRLPEAIEQKLLVPFHYYGVSDETDLSNLTWTKGGYAKNELEALYLGNRSRAAHVFNSVLNYCGSFENLKILGFCVSVAHACFMAEFFTENGVPSIALDGSSSPAERLHAQKDLEEGKTVCIFTCELYNEGVDIPSVNTVLFLRPTESLTIFLQQLGRGLRLYEGKDALTVLDFIGAANRKYDFVSKFRTILCDPAKDIRDELKKGFPSVPKGCLIQLEKKAESHVLSNIKNSIQTRKAIMEQMKHFEQETGQPLDLKNFLFTYQMSPKMLYSRLKEKGKNVSFYQTACDAGLFPELKESASASFLSRFVRMASIDSEKWIKFLAQMIDTIDTFERQDLDEEQKRMMDMLFISFFNKKFDSFSNPETRLMFSKLKENGAWKKEMKELLDVQYESIDCLQLPYEKDIPLDIHAAYTRDQLFCALNYEKPQIIREGVKWLPEAQSDVLLVTLNKSEKDYSPTTLYKDYSVSKDLFHWQSQSTTAPESAAGMRYINHQAQGSSVLLFVREFKTDPVTKAAMPYTFLGPVEYVKHEGSRPMNILWKMKYPIPAKFLEATDKIRN